jgi:tRNA (uracil-5-)-methyltransferase
MDLLGHTYEVHPNSFFQTNIATCELLYSRALEWASMGPNGKGSTALIDVCCGVGTIGISASKHCFKVVGVELVPEAVEDAKANALKNGTTNVSFVCGKAEEELTSVLEELAYRTPEVKEIVAIVDPPRAGLHPAVLRALRTHSQISRLVYISCNPESLSENVAVLCAPSGGTEPFQPTRAVAVDMFPHTLHCEAIVELRRGQLLGETSDPVEGVAGQPEDA